MKVLGFLIFLAVVLIVLYGVGKIVWGSTRGGQVERLAHLSDRYLRKAARAYRVGRPGLAEQYLDLHQRMLDEIDERNEKDSSENRS